VNGSSGKRAQLVAATANRLRLVQADFADQAGEVRRDYLNEELERALANIVPDQRQDFLKELMEQFPSWDARVEVQLRKEETTDRTLMDEKELKDPNFLVARLISLAPSLSEQDRRVLVERLREANLASLSQASWSEEAAGTLRKGLRMAPADAIDPTRAVELLAMLVELATKLDQLVWSSWKRVAPKSTIRRGQNLQLTLQAFLAGSGDVPRGQVAADLEKLRQLIASLVSAIGQAGRQFAGRHLARFSPIEIEALAGMEGGGFLVSKEVKCWRKYMELAGTLNEAAIESEIMETIANYAESLMKGLGR